MQLCSFCLRPTPHQIYVDNLNLLLDPTVSLLSALLMSALSDFHTVQLIIKHCMKAEGVADEEFALQVANQKGIILHGKATRAGRIVAALVDANQEVTEFNIRQISERLDGYRPQANRLHR